MTISSGESMDNIPVPEDEKLIIRCFSTPPGPLYSLKYVFWKGLLIRLKIEAR